MEQKNGGEIRRRLNILENDLKNIREKIAHGVSCIENKAKNDTKIITYFRRPLVAKNIHAQKNSLRKETSTAFSKDEGVFNFIPKNIPLDGNQIFTCLQNINKNIAKGSEAMRKIASLTELTNVPCNSPFPVGMEGNWNRTEDSSVKAFHTNSDSSIKPEMHSLTHVKRLKKSSSEETGLVKRNFNTQKQIVEAPKKETIDASYKIYLGKHKAAIIEEIAKLTKELEIERNKNNKLEENSEKLQQALEDSTKKMSEMMEEKKMLLSMTTKMNNKFERLQCSKNHNGDCIRLLKNKNKNLAERLEELQNYTEVKNLEFERLQKDLKYLKEYKNKEQEWLAVIEDLKEKLNINERELNKQINESKHRDALNDQVVTEEIDKHKKLYLELKEEMSKMETKLKVRSEELENELVKVTKNSDERFDDLLIKYKTTKTELEKQEYIVHSLTEKIQFLYQELQEEKNRVAEYCEINEHQEDVINKLTNAISNRDDHLKKIMREGIITLKARGDMQKQITILQQSLEQKNAAIEDLKKQVETEKDNVLIKDKMLNDQLDTIKCLRKTVEENRKVIEEGKSEIKKMTKDYQQLECYKDELLEQISQTQDIIEDAKGSIEREKRHEYLLQQIECQVMKKHKDWETQLQLMTNEKNKAITTARYTTQKLMEAMTEFQKQIEIAKNKQIQLEKSLNRKTYELEKATEEITELKLKLGHHQDKIKLLGLKLKNTIHHSCEACDNQIDSYNSKMEVKYLDVCR